ncbi:MAG: glycosyl transferase [Bacteroidetes bacterium]|nr:MAG: glycosyl transferase [Bacteroidota bacterium]
MREILKYLYHNTFLGHHIIHLLLRLNTFYLHRVLPEKVFLERNFRKAFNRDLNLENPETLNEKIVWLKLNDRTPLHTQCADKYAVRDYVEVKIGKEYLVPLFYMTKDPRDITPDNLPNIPCIIKTNHDSSGGIFVEDKNNTNWLLVRKSLKKRLKHNYYYGKKEWQYKNIEPCIIVEKLLTNNDGKIPDDYKIHCFNGKVQMIQVDVDRHSDNRYRLWYNIKWKREPYTWFRTNKEDYNKAKPKKIDVEKPKKLNKMVELSEILSEDFRYVRVDWYDVDGILYFGELTFHHDSGNTPILPEEWDKKLGNKLVL